MITQRLITLIAVFALIACGWALWEKSRAKILGFALEMSRQAVADAYQLNKEAVAANLALTQRIEKIAVAQRDHRVQMTILQNQYAETLKPTVDEPDDGCLDIFVPENLR